MLTALESANPELLLLVTPLNADAAPTAEKQLDLLTAIKASQALSRETAVDGLTQALLRVVLEHAGAQRAVVLLNQQERLCPVGAASTTGETSYELPESIVRYVARTRTAVVLADARTDLTFGEDAYLARTRARARSVLCLPILVHSSVVGLLYLENNLTADAFSAQRLALLEVVSTRSRLRTGCARFRRSRTAKSDSVLRLKQVQSETGRWTSTAGRSWVRSSSTRSSGIEPCLRTGTTDDSSSMFFRMNEGPSTAASTTLSNERVRGASSAASRKRTGRPGGLRFDDNCGKAEAVVQDACSGR